MVYFPGLRPEFILGMDLIMALQLEIRLLSAPLKGLPFTSQACNPGIPDQTNRSGNKKAKLHPQNIKFSRIGHK